MIIIRARDELDTLGVFAMRRVWFDGMQCLLTLDSAKPMIRKAGYVFLGPAFEETLPVIRLDGRNLPPSESFESITLRGYTNDPIMLRLFDEFRAAVFDGSWTPGDVSIPLVP